MRRIVSLALGSFCLAGCISVNQGSRPLGSIVQTETALPQPGDWCRVTYPETRNGLEHHQTFVTGKVESIDDEGLHLSEVTTRQIGGVPIAEKVPVVRRLFKNTGIGPEPDRIVKLDGTETLQIISEQEGRQLPPPPVSQDQNIAQHLVAAVPGRR